MSNPKIISLDSLSLQEFDTEAELIPLLTPEDEEEMAKEELPASLAILPLRNTVLFPGVVIPITAGRDKSIKLINEAYAGTKIIGVVAQKNEEDEDPTKNDIYHLGTVAKILRVLKMPDGNITVILQGKKRFEIDEVISETPYITAKVKEVPENKPKKNDKEFSAIVDSIKELAIEIIRESPNIPTEATFAIKNIESQSFLINFVSSNMNLSVEEKQNLLKMHVLKERALETLRYMNVELQKMEIKNDIQSKVRFDLDQQQREYFLHQQMKTIQEELGRMIEHLAVLKLRNDMKSPIICLTGPPGVGKTSIGKSVAEALGREYVRISLGGLRDEAEIRGHRKTYIGAMPGRIIQSIKKAKTSNPVFILDEIDKLSMSNQGDPSSALLEVLDPEQNNSFYDNFLELGYDLSKVMFIATSNTMSTIQPALRDRMELIKMSGYTTEERKS